MMRLPAAQRWPALLKAERAAQRAAGSRSASSQTTSGFLPPSSSDTRARREPATRAISRPTAVDPVKLTTATRGSATSGAPASSPRPWTMLSTPGGRPASWAMRPKHQAVAGVSSAAFRTAALPHTRAGNTFHATLAIGVLAAMMRPAIPRGSRTVIVVRCGTALVVVRP